LDPYPAQAAQEQQALRAQLGLQVLMEQQAHPAQQVLMEQQAQQVLMELRAQLDLQELTVQPAPQEQLA
jgi:hypothetical protein